MKHLAVLAAAVLAVVVAPAMSVAQIDVDSDVGFAAAEAFSPSRFAPAPTRPTYCWTRRDYAPTRDRAKGGCDAGSGILQLEVVCYYFDGGPYRTAQTTWKWAPASFDWVSCPSSEPLLYTVRLDFVRP